MTTETRSNPEEISEGVDAAFAIEWMQRYMVALVQELQDQGVGVELTSQPLDADGVVISITTTPYHSDRDRLAGRSRGDL